MALIHSLHLAVARALAAVAPARALYLDPACGGHQLLSLFVGDQPSVVTRICEVDALIVVEGQVRVIVEIEESGFIPTKICGKLLTSALATHFIHASLPGKAIPLGSDVLFIQVLDRIKLGPGAGHKAEQAELIAERVREGLPLGVRGIAHYEMYLPRGPADCDVLTKLQDSVRQILTGS